MAQILHLKCRRCGEKLKNREEAYCPPCNVYLCYRAMPILLGMVLTGHLAPDLKEFPMGAAMPWMSPPQPHPYEDESLLIRD